MDKVELNCQVYIEIHILYFLSLTLPVEVCIFFFNNYAVFCNETIIFLHSPGMKTARKQAEKVDVLHEYVRYCVTHRQQ
ncbi:hypothetical protein LC613_31515 [Nostoc sphaeroides CHAB 2801]|uniref:hypothetical protein n=1 Tax=Nostoc sphaeroides TaxID=446679 RepID=UPI00126A4F9A|nr:hypothetical protein [Nostoc sphaeroides]MCC5632187.1 hypothetical protein [Nostoc sphaeroides CHAB 2801]